MTEPKSCCGPSRSGKASAAAQIDARREARPQNCIEVPGGLGLIGTQTPQILADGEGPMKRKKLRALLWEPGAVTVAQFRAFVEATGFVTEADQFGWTFVFHLQVPEGQPPTAAVPGLDWWRRIDGANWERPLGPFGPIAEPDHPVTQVSWNDAVAYCKWAGGRLPSEGEWEHAARGGLGDARFPWGDKEPNDHDFFPCNIWQGQFPHVNSCKDGYSGTAPAISFEPNGYGLYNMVGNVWQWTCNPYKVRSLKKTARYQNANHGGHKITKGGSFLCHKSYCYRYRIAARTGNSPESATTHMGFRIVYDLA